MEPALGVTKGKNISPVFSGVYLLRLNFFFFFEKTEWHEFAAHMVGRGGTRVNNCVQFWSRAGKGCAFTTPPPKKNVVMIQKIHMGKGV